MINLYHKHFCKLYYCFNNVNIYFNNKILKSSNKRNNALHLFKDPKSINCFVVDFYNSVKLKYFTLTPDRSTITETKFKYIPDFNSFCKIVFKNI